MDTRISVIYNIRNLINDKGYIGSAIDFKARQVIHRCQLLKDKHHSKHLQRAYNKHGKDNFIYEIIEYVEDKTKLIEREQVWLDFFNPEYNICKTAGSSLGVKRSDEFKAKISLYQNKPVLQFDKDMKFIMEYKSLSEAMEKTNAWQIGKVCKGERKTSGGFIWMYKKEVQEGGLL